MRVSNTMIMDTVTEKSIFTPSQCHTKQAPTALSLGRIFRRTFNTLRKAIIGFTLLSSIAVTANAEEKIYRSTDKQGNTVFTDQATEDAQEVEIKETATYTETIPTYTPISTANDETEQKGYNSLSILAPAPESSIRSNSGSMTVSYRLEPSLQPKHSTRLLMDGNPMQSSAGGGSFSITNVDRGTHTLTVQVIDERGSVVKASESVMVTVLRYAQVKRVRPHAGS